jgi:hypothetical protein
MAQNSHRFQGQLRVKRTSSEKLPPSLGGRNTPVSKSYFRVAAEGMVNSYGNKAIMTFGSPYGKPSRHAKQLSGGRQDARIQRIQVLVRITGLSVSPL